MTGTLPYTLTFEPVPQTSALVRPNLQAYMWLRQANGVFMLGGRQAGLHQFKTQGNNFPQPNQTIWWADLESGSFRPLLDLTLVTPELAAPLSATDQQSYYDADADEWLIVGGYGIDAAANALRTFDTLIRIPVAPFVNTMMSSLTPPQKAASFEKLVSVQRDPFFAVTGGALRKLGGRYLLLFGQRMQGSYNPFVGIMEQEYIEAVRFFRFDAQRRAVGMGEIRSPDLDKPFHRRDGPVVDTLDPDTGGARVAAFGGVFPPGKLGGYLNPVFVEAANGRLSTSTDRGVSQLFCQYTCPVVVVWDASASTAYHTFFGGISRSWYWQNAAQQQIYEQVTAEGRNDGLPFVADISTLVLGPDGYAAEWIAPAPVPNYSLHGASTDFIPLTTTTNPALDANGIVNLAELPAGAPTLIGHIYGGVEAQYPLPVIPNYGTSATSAIYRVLISPTPAGGYIPASAGNLANGVLTPPIMSASPPPP